MAYKAACDRIMALCRAQTWIKQAPNDPPAVAAQFPFAALFPGTGDPKREPDVPQDIHTVRLEIHWTLKDIPRATADAKDHVDDIAAMLWDDPTLNTTVATLVSVHYEFGPMAWGAVETLGFVFSITFKVRRV